MISVMSAKFVADAFGKSGIYAVWIAMHNYPWLSPMEHRDQGETAAHIMKPKSQLVMVEQERCTLEYLGESVSPFEASI